jgi:hypothetical protein
LLPLTAIILLGLPWVDASRSPGHTGFVPISVAEIARELAWLKANPHFEERPASIREFLGPSYLNIQEYVRPAIVDVLVDIFGEEPSPNRISMYQKAIFTGGIGIGKTTVASVVLPYMAHWVLCLKNPQHYFGLIPGSRIAFMQMSTSGPQAKEVVFGDIKARIENSPWFKSKYPYDSAFKNQIRFSQKDIWILPGDSAETTFEGYNILGGILDEIDSHKITRTKDYAEQGYTTIHGRITSRFLDRGFIMLVGQMKKSSGFAARMYRNFKKDPTAYTAIMTIWESLGWGRFMTPDGKRDSFWYDCNRFSFVSGESAEFQGFPVHIIEVPNAYRADFENSPKKALRDLAGRPPAVNSPFFHDVSKIEATRLAWMNMNGSEPPVGSRGELASWLKPRNSLKRVVHVDIAYSGEGDALGIAMGHVPELVEIDGETKPFICIDLLLRIKAPPGKEIFLGDIRRIIYELRDDRGFVISKVTTDGFQSTDFRQQLARRRIQTEVVSVDRNMIAYADLYDAVMEGRIAIPPYLTYLREDDGEPSDILLKELSELQETGSKIDHPPDGSKDLADALAAVVFTLMSGRTFHSKVRNMPVSSANDGSSVVNSASGAWFSHPAVNLEAAPAASPVAPLAPIPWTPPSRGR